MKKVLGLTLVVAFLVAGFGFAPAASAEASGPEAASLEETLATGAGVLTANGDGIAVLGGMGVVDLSGNGLLWVRDIAGNAVIEVTGYGEKKQFDNGWIQYAGFNGTAHIEGSRVVVVIAGADVDLEARGYGRTFLWGHGNCERNGETYQWNTRLGLRMRLHNGDGTAGPGPNGAAQQLNNRLGQRLRLHNGEYSGGLGLQNRLGNHGGW